jgi:enoyl-CoA hydratase/carnithine racemase
MPSRNRAVVRNRTFSRLRTQIIRKDTRVSTESDNRAVQAHIVEDTLVITISREAKRNALSPDVTDGIDAAMNRLEDDPQLRCAILTGGRNVFSAGADLSDGVGYPTERGGLVGLIRRRRTKPLIAAVEGAALGGGMELVLCCDLVVAGRGASFGLPEVKLGLIPDFGGAFRAGRNLPVNVAREMLLTGRSIDAERAERIGFVNQLTPAGEALPAALELAGAINANAPLAIREVLGVANERVLHEDDDDWLRSDAAHLRLVVSRDFREGVKAFFARRPPKWEGR